MLQGICDALGGEENTRKLIEEKSPILNKVREGFGGRIKWMLSGSAPINTKVIELLGKIMSCPFAEAYGQTENTGGAFIQNLNENEYGRIGHVWVRTFLYSPTISSNWPIFQKWATPVTTKTTMGTPLQGEKSG